ncbi:MAG: hypothetical protein R3B09_29045 [Nannocystaceae bacterium]
MHRVVVVTPDNELISDVTLPPEQLVEHVTAFAVIHNTGIYIDGQLLPPEQREALVQGLLARARQPPQIAALPTPAEVLSWTEVLQRSLNDTAQGYADVRKAQAQCVHDMQAFMREYAEMHLRAQREMADEAVRQRQLTAQSLGDIDLLDRAATTVRLNQAMASAAESFARPRVAAAAASTSTAVARRDGLTLSDWLHGFMDLAGES